MRHNPYHIKNKISQKNPKLIVIVGPTASGKSELAVKIAKKFNGAVISVDSRQIYKGMDIGSGKVAGQWKRIYGTQRFVYKNIVHYGIDQISPQKQFSSIAFQSLAESAITEIIQQGKQPILCGGTGHWVDMIVNKQVVPAVAPNPIVRKLLAQYPTEQLFALLTELDPARAKNIDVNNRHRLIRAIEVNLVSGKPVPAIQNSKDVWPALWIGLSPDKQLLSTKIANRLRARFRQGMLNEIEQLHTKHKLSWKKLEAFGLEYKFGALYLQDKLLPTNTKKQLQETLNTEIRNYAKRQMTWWKKNKSINWFADASPKNLTAIFSLISRSLTED